MCMLAVCTGKQQLTPVLTCSTCMAAVASQQVHDNTCNWHAVHQAVLQPTWHEWFRWSPTCLGMFVFQAAMQATWHEWCRWTPTCLGMFVLQPELQAVTPGDILEWSGRPASKSQSKKNAMACLQMCQWPGGMPKDMPRLKRINVMVGITRSKVFFCKASAAWGKWENPKSLSPCLNVCWGTKMIKNVKLLQERRSSRMASALKSFSVRFLA